MVQDKSPHINLALYKDLFNALYPSLCLFANRYMRDMDASKDVVQEVFIKFWTKKMSVKNLNTLKAYLYKSVKNKCLDELNSSRVKRTVSVEMAHVAQVQDPAFFLSEILSVETYNLLENAIQALPAKCEQIIRLSLFDYSTNEIAEELAITASTVRTQRQIAYEKLRHALSFFKMLLLALIIFISWLLDSFKI